MSVLDLWLRCRKRKSLSLRGSFYVATPPERSEQGCPRTRTTLHLRLLSVLGRSFADLQFLIAQQLQLHCASGFNYQNYQHNYWYSAKARVFTGLSIWMDLPIHPHSYFAVLSAPLITSRELFTVHRCVYRVLISRSGV